MKTKIQTPIPTVPKHSIRDSRDKDLCAHLHQTLELPPEVEVQEILNIWTGMDPDRGTSGYLFLKFPTREAARQFWYSKENDDFVIDLFQRCKKLWIGTVAVFDPKGMVGADDVWCRGGPLPQMIRDTSPPPPMPI